MWNLNIFRGFVKYKRETSMYRPAEARQKDWGEIYNFEGVRKGLRVQAARCMDCGVPFCQSSHGCPLGNIIPKWNDLIFNNNWKEALSQLLQTNNFPGKLASVLCYYLSARNLQDFIWVMVPILVKLAYAICCPVPWTYSLTLFSWGELYFC